MAMPGGRCSFSIWLWKRTPRGRYPADKNSTHLAPRDVPHAEREEYFGERGEDVIIRSDLSTTLSDLCGSNMYRRSKSRSLNPHPGPLPREEGGLGGMNQELV